MSFVLNREGWRSGSLYNWWRLQVFCSICGRQSRYASTLGLVGVTFQKEKEWAVRARKRVGRRFIPKREGMGGTRQMEAV